MRRSTLTKVATCCLLLAGGANVMADPSLNIDSAAYPDWPFPDQVGVLLCDAPGTNVVLRTETGVFALNGKALGQVSERGYLDARQYQQRDEHGMFTNGVSTISELIKLGLPLCEGGAR